MPVLDCPFRLHVSQYEGKTLEELIAPATEPDPWLLNGVVVEATYAARDPELLQRLRSLRIPYAIDVQTIRFAGDGFLRSRGLSRLPYAPRGRLSTPPDDEFYAVARGALKFAADHEADEYLLPAMPYHKPNLREGRAFDASQRQAFDLVGVEVPRRPVYAYVAPAAAVLRSPDAVYQRLLDRAFAGIYVQPLRLHPRQDSVERLIKYVQFLLSANDIGLPVIAGRAGTFGLVLMALGVHAVDSGLGERETFDLASLDRERPERNGSKQSGGRAKVAYLRELMTSVPMKTAVSVIRHPALRSHFICEEGECSYAGIEGQIDRPRAHFFHTRPAELAELRSRPTVETRVQYMADRLRTAIDVSDQVNRVLLDDGLAPLDLDHLRRWALVLTRVAASISSRRDR